MRNTYSLMLVGVMALVPVTRAATRTVTTDAATGAGSLTAAINALNDGDTIAFNIPPGAGEVHYIQTPFDGYPLITKNNITIDGYTQPGASPNTNSIHAANNAQLKICLSSTNGNALSMYSAVTNFAGFDYPNLGFGDSEQALLGFFRATNAWVKGLAILSSYTTSTTYAAGGDSKTICFAVDAPDVSTQACQSFHVSGCWFGVDPVTRQVAYMPDGVNVATPTICIATYGTGTNGTPGYTNVSEIYASGTLGVAPGSPTPHAEFNVFVTGYGFDSQGGPFHVSGNFWGVLPDGVTAADMSVLNGGAQQGDGFTEYGDPHDVTVGTDGDGINDADEGNIFGPWANGKSACINLYHGPQTNIVIAGNYFNADIHGNAFGLNLGTIVNSFANVATARFGSDFNGVSDALEGNLAFNEILFAFDSNWTTNTAWLSMRGNSMTNCASPAYSTPPLGDGYDGPTYGLNTYSQFIDTSGLNGAVDIVPVISAGTTATSLSGTCGKPLGAPYTNLVVDLYEADTSISTIPQGKRWIASFFDNSAADSNAAVGAFTFSTAGLGLTSGMQVTITVTYVSDTRPRIGSISRAGNQTTIKINNPGAATYGIQKSSTAKGTYSFTAAAVKGSATFTDSSAASFYQVTAPTSTGQTSPFSAVYTIP